MTKPNILFIVLDTARQRNAYTGGIMPALASIANEPTSVRYDTAIASAPWTFPSHASMFSGLLPSDHGSHANAKQFDPGVTPLAKALSDRDYETLAYSNNLWISPDFGFETGFETFWNGWDLFDSGEDIVELTKEANTTKERALTLLREVEPKTAVQTFANALYGRSVRKRYDKGALLTTWQLRRWLSKRNQHNPFFTFVNLLEPHGPYDPPKRWAKQFLPAGVSPSEAQSINQDPWAYVARTTEMSDRDFEILEALHNAELAYTDLRLRQLYETLDETGELENTLLVICGDHGDNIGDHGLMDHQYSLHETLLNVPLVVRYPESVRREYDLDTTGSQLIALRDLYVTLLDAATDRSEQPADLIESDAQSTHSLLRDPEREHVVSEYLTPQPAIDTLIEETGVDRSAVEQFDRGLRSYRTPNQKFIEGTDGSEWLFDLEDDPDESNDRSQAAPEMARNLQSDLYDTYGPQWVSDNASAANESDISPGVEGRLEDLGYL